MKRLLILLSVLVCALFFARPVSAHLAGQPPFFRINGVFSNLYTVPQAGYIALTPFPQDDGPTQYTVNTPIDFAFDIGELSKVVPKEIIDKTKFVWNFGDGTTGDGEKNIHTYTKPGSYVLEITADTSSFEANSEPQLIQSVILHVKENDSYKLPKFQIFVNGVEGKDAYGEGTQVNFKKPLNFEAKILEEGSTKITSYEWDFGAGELGTGTSITHTYDPNSTSVMVVLRVKDEKGFIVDTAVGLVNNPSLYSVLSDPVVTPLVPSANNNNNAGVIRFFVVITVIILILGLLFVRKRSKPQN